MWLNGSAIDPAASYSVTVNSFLAAGGDNFGAFATGTSKKDTGQTDLQAMVDYMNAHTPVSPDFTQRSVGVMFPAGAPASYLPGDQVNFDLSSLAFSTASWKSPARVRMPTSRPSFSSRASLSADPEVPMTRASSALAVCSAATPTPEDTPVTSSHCPAVRWPWATSMS